MKRKSTYVLIGVAAVAALISVYLYYSVLFLNRVIPFNVDDRGKPLLEAAFSEMQENGTFDKYENLKCEKIYYKDQDTIKGKECIKSQFFMSFPTIQYMCKAFFSQCYILNLREEVYNKEEILFSEINTFRSLAQKGSLKNSLVIILTENKFSTINGIHFLKF